MAKRAALQLTTQQQEELTRITQSRTESVAKVLSRLSRKWTFRPFELKEYQLPLNC